jgi:hypothetical protein
METNLPLFSMFYRNALWITAPLFVTAVVLLSFFILKIIRLEKKSQLLSLPLLEEQTIAFSEAGPVILCIKGPRFTSRFAKFTYELKTADGTPVSGRALLFRATTTGISTVTMAIRKYEIPRAGSYILRIQGLKTDKNKVNAIDDQCAIIFTRPHLARAIGNVIGIVFSALLTIGSLVFFLMRLFVK